jgi:hypothetical protein
LSVPLAIVQVKKIDAEWYRIEDPDLNIYDDAYDPWSAPQNVLNTLDMCVCRPTPAARLPHLRGAPAHHSPTRRSRCRPFHRSFAGGS